MRPADGMLLGSNFPVGCRCSRRGRVQHGFRREGGGGQEWHAPFQPEPRQRACGTCVGACEERVQAFSLESQSVKEVFLGIRGLGRLGFPVLGFRGSVQVQVFLLHVSHTLAMCSRSLHGCRAS